ncbi:c-type cytochrome [Phenylobacterium sp.]|uniref:c-type cytochrome n=1 Tax=Phenylobacterium sp. TaxID=1871053 RepID=UPI002FD91EC1
MRSPISSAAVAVAVVLTSGLLGAAIAQTPAGKAVESRQAGFKQIGAAFKTVNDQLRGNNPDWSRLTPAAERLGAHAQQLPTWFPKGSGAEAGVKTAARPEIWTDAAGFADAASRLARETEALKVAVAAKDVEAARRGARATGQACAACHDQYRLKD